MPDRLPFGEVRPQAQPLSTFLQPVQPNIGAVGQPSGVGRPDGISTIQIAGGGNVQGFNQQQQLADALAPFSSALTKLAGEGMLSYAKGKIEEGYWDELKNSHARSVAGYQLQQEQGATNAGTTISQLSKVDPEAARILSDANPWRLVGRRRAAAQLAGQEVDDALEADLRMNPGLLSGLAPGSPELKQRKVELTQPVLKRYGLTGDEPEAQFYTIPKLNQAWDKYTEKQGTLFSQTLKANTIDLGTASLARIVTSASQDGIPLADGTTVTMGDARFPGLLGSLIGAEADKQLGMLGGNDRTEAVKTWRTQLFGTYGQFPQIAAALGMVPTGPATVRVIGEDGKPKEIPEPNRPTWGAIAPLDNLELINKGNGLKLQQYDQQQQGIKQQLDGLWWGKGMPGSLLPSDPGYPAALIQFRNQAGAMGLTDIDGYMKGRMDSQTAVISQVARPDPLAAEDFITKINDLPRSAFGTPEGIQEIRRQARAAAQAEPTPELQAQRYREYVKAIDDKAKQAADTTPGLQEAIDKALLVDLGQGPVAQKINQAAVAKAQATKTAPVNPLQQLISGSAGAVAAVGALGNAKIQAFTVRLNDLFLRNAEAKIDEWQATHPGVPLTASVRNVLISGSIADTRKSEEYKQTYQELTGLAPGQVGPGKAGTAPGPQVKGVPRSAAGSLPASTAKAYGARPVLDGDWLHDELESVANGKPVSPQLFNLAKQAGTTTNRYLLEQLRFYPQLDPQGEARKFLQQQIQKQKAGQTVSQANYPQLSGQRVASAPSVAGFNPLAPGSWLMNMLTPPAAAATLPASYARFDGGGGGGSIPFGGSGVTNTAPFNGVLSLLRSGEGGWNSANRGVAGDTPGGVAGLSGMTLGQWKGLQARGYNALGAYQFIPKTLKLAASELGLPDSTVMTPEVQGRLAVQLMVGTKRPRLAAYMRGKSNDLGAALDDLALEWASVHTRGGGTAYAGIGGNAASISRSGAGQALVKARQAFLAGGDGGGGGGSGALRNPRGIRPAEFGSGFGAQESFRRNPHEGQDVRISHGTPLGLAVGGTVLRVYRTTSTSKDANGGYGNYMDLRLANGQVIRLAHLSYIPANIRDGAPFSPDQMLGRSGGTVGAAGSGRSSGPHLHMEQLLSPMGQQETTRGKADPRRNGGTGLIRLGDRADAAPAGAPGGQQTASSKPPIGDQFIAQIEGEKGWEDTAGLQPLPVQRMLRQAGRPMSNNVPRDRRKDIPIFNENRENKLYSGSASWSRYTVDPERWKQTIERNLRTRNTILNWDPLEAELKQKFNNMNPNPRSRLAAPSRETFDKTLEPLIREWRQTISKANIKLPGGRGIQIDSDVSDLADDKMAAEIKGQLFRYLDAVSASRKEEKLHKWNLPGVMQASGGLGKMGNDLLYEWNNRDKAAQRENTVDMLGVTHEAVRPVEPFSPLFDHNNNPNKP